jgi:flagellar hook-basal body complex protein FliE
MNFDKLVTVQDWTEALRELIRRGQNAVDQNNTEEIGNVQDLLFDFQLASPKSFDDLDEIAFKTAQELNAQNRAALLTTLTELSQKLVDLSHTLDVSTEQALAKSDEIRLKNVINGLDKAKTGLDILLELREDLRDKDSELGKKVEAVFIAIKEFKEAFKDT